MASREETVSKLRGTPEGLASVEDVQAMLAADPKLKCVVCYARISFDGRAKDAHGVEDQHREMADTARRFGWLVVYRYTDNDKSASKEEVIREDFEQLLRDLAAGHTPEGYPIHGVMAVNDDRLYRRPGDWERYLRAFTSQEGRVYHDSNGLQDLYAEGFEIKGLLGVAMSLAETRKKQRRARNSHRNRALRGKSVSAWRPFGWEDDKITLRPREAEAVRKAVRDIIAGASIFEIIRQWQDAEFRTSRGNYFQHQTAKQLLTNPRLCGYRAIKGEIVRDGDDEPVIGEWEPIITPEEWFAVTATLRSRHPEAGIPRGKLVHKYLLTGILRCGNTLPDGSICNNKMVGTKANSWLTYEHVYVCKKTPNGGCWGTSKRGDKTDRHVQDLVIAKLEAQAATRAEAIPDWENEEALTTATQSRKELERHWQEGRINDETFFRNLPAIEERIKKLQAEQAEHLAKKAAAQAIGPDIARTFYSKTLRQRRELIQSALHAVIAVSGGKGNKPFNVELLTPVWRSSE
ncbi:recombinase family protein [Streptomyces aidingensis]|uniref:Site-specific DNA recombinase n=1 Tax=Streptomyces aidingensis TaxID=910347 RepID=A0A1I1QMQ6_9ACTN|nr:recombinase family protein [Streptomyces aidingensis]SFD21128.1 Site-specific DNA recombinase [Streptomyces aidingensis]